LKVINVFSICLFALCLSCNKDSRNIDCWFNLNPPDEYRNSISSIVIKYSESSENTKDLENPDIYQFTVNADSKKSNCDVYPCSIDYGYITLKEGAFYVLKGFDLVDSSGKTLFKLSWKPDSIHGAVNIQYLPYVFTARERIFLSFNSLSKAITK
jgi:hypothetical protein